MAPRLVLPQELSRDVGLLAAGRVAEVRVGLGVDAEVDAVALEVGEVCAADLAGPVLWREAEVVDVRPGLLVARLAQLVLRLVLEEEVLAVLELLVVGQQTLHAHEF